MGPPNFKIAAHNAFVSLTKEKWEFNQYWYSPHTVKMMAKEIEENATKLDTQWAKSPNFVRYDYNQPYAIDESLHHVFDCVVIDPPFITPEVWAKYAETARLLLGAGGKIILSTIPENADMLKQMLQVEPQVFQPSIPHLVYQYLLYTNFPTKYLSTPNPELQ